MLSMKLTKKQTKKRIYKKIIFTFLMFAFSPLLIIYFSLLTICGIIFSPIEYLIYRRICKKLNFTSKYYPLILKFEKLIIKSMKILNKLNCDYEFDPRNKVVLIKSVNTYLSFGLTNKRYIFYYDNITIRSNKDLYKIYSCLS